MITLDEKNTIMQAASKKKFLLNGHIQWSFADDYHLVFAKMIPDINCPMKTIKLVGTATLENCKCNARLFISHHEDLQKWSSILCLLDCNDNVMKSFNVISIQELAQ